MKSILSSLVTGFFVLASLSTGFAQDFPPTLVETAPVKSMEFHDQITLIGRTEAWVQSRIVSEVSGRVVSIDAAEGNRIDRGELLVTIEPTKTRLSFEARDAETRQAEATAELARGQYERAIELYSQKLISESGRDSAQVWLVVNEEKHRQLAAERDDLAYDLANCAIRAPFTGFTVKKLVDVGEWVSPGTPVYEMVDISRIKVTVDLPEKYFGHLRIGSPVMVYASNNDDKPIAGTVIGIARQASEETHTFPVIISIRNDDGELGAGMLTRSTLSLDNNFTSLAVSKDAVVRQGLNTLVYAVADGKAVPIPVFLSSTKGDTVAVSGEGLSEGMPVVVRGNERIFPGSPVQVAGQPPAQPNDNEDQSTPTEES